MTKQVNQNLESLTDSCYAKMCDFDPYDINVQFLGSDG